MGAEVEESGALTPRRIVDFHRHWVSPELLDGAASVPTTGLLRDLWPLLTDTGAQLEALERDGIDLGVLSTPLEMLAQGGRPVSADLVRQTNDLLAEVVAEHRPRITALASIDAFAGEQAAEEARRAVDELGLPGLFVATVSGELLLDAPQARPTLQFAAERGVPVFAHPVNPPVLEARFAGVAGAGHALGRATESAISILALLRCGLLHELPGLHVVIAQLSSVSLLLAHYLDAPATAGDGAPGEWKPSDDRARLFVDTAGFEPIAVRAALEAVGVEHLLLGSDWPVDVELRPPAVGAVLNAAGVAAEDLDRVAAGNALELLGLELASGEERSR
jgi:predicted TIM-barrel fold metal-dependent hydrolase